MSRPSSARPGSAHSSAGTRKPRPATASLAGRGQHRDHTALPPGVLPAQNGPSTYRLVRHVETQPSNMAPNQVKVTIEHCCDCETHVTTTRHVEDNYTSYAARAMDAIQAAFPFIEVYRKPTRDLTMRESPSGADGQPCWTMGRNHSKFGKWPRECGHKGLPTPRLGAFEMQMAVWQAGESSPVVTLLHSKLMTGKWPRMSAVVKAIAEKLPAKRLQVTVQVFDYEDGKPSEVPAPNLMIVTAAAGARVETTELMRDLDTSPPMSEMEIPLGCEQVMVAATDSTLENTAEVDDAVVQSGAGPHSVRLLRIPIHTAPMVRCVIRVAAEGNWDPSLARLTASKPVIGSSWQAEEGITESGEAWLFPPSDSEHVACTDLQLGLSVGSGPSAWRLAELRQMHPYGTTNLLVEFPVLRTTLFAPQNVTDGKALSGGEAKLLTINGHAVTGRSFTPCTDAFYLEPGRYTALVRVPGCFDCTHSFSIKADSPESVPVQMRPKTLKKLGKVEVIEVDEPPEKMLSLWNQSRGAGELDCVFIVEESATMKQGIVCMHRTLGGDGQKPGDIPTFMMEVPSCVSLQIAVVSYRGITREAMEAPNESGKPVQEKKRVEELKMDACTVRQPFSNNWVGLKVAVSGIGVEASRDETYHSLAEAIKTAVNNLPWRANAARAAIFVSDHSSMAAGGGTLTPAEVLAGPPSANLPFLPDALKDSAQLLRAHGCRSIACFIGENEEPAAVKVDMELGRVFKALVAATGGALAVCTSKGQGTNVASVGACDTALHQQVIDDYLVNEPFKNKLDSLLDGSPEADDPEVLRTEVGHLLKALAGQLNDFGLLSREFFVQDDTKVPGVQSVPVKASDVATALLHALVKNVVALRAEVKQLLVDTPLASWDA